MDKTLAAKFTCSKSTIETLGNRNTRKRCEIFTYTYIHILSFKKTNQNGLS